MTVLLKSFDFYTHLFQPGLIQFTNFLDGYTDDIAFSDCATCINKIRLGTSFYERIGNKIKLKSISIKFSLRAVMNGFPVPVGQPVVNFINDCTSTSRCLVVLDNTPNGTYPDLRDILSDYDSSGLISFNDDFHCGVNSGYSSRFRILRDMLCEVSFSKFVKNVKMFINMKDYETCFKGDASDITEISTGAVYLIIFCNDASPVTGKNLKIKIRYTDN